MTPAEVGSYCHNLFILYQRIENITINTVYILKIFRMCPCKCLLATLPQEKQIQDAS